MTFISYAQNFEDVMLWRALKHVKNGFYLDVGAYSPDDESVTKAFYIAGWCGINIEPNSDLISLYEEKRKEDINLGIAISDKTGEAEMYFVSNHGLSSLDKNIAEGHRSLGWESSPAIVETRTLANVCEEYCVQKEIHFLKVDVEGFEERVLKGNDWMQFRPWIVVVEATLPMTQIENHEDWEMVLLDADYSMVYADGLNRFYVSKEHEELRQAFKYPPNVFDDFKSILETQAAAEARMYEVRASQAEAKVEQLQAELSVTHSSYSWRMTAPLREFLYQLRMIQKHGLFSRLVFLIKKITASVTRQGIIFINTHSGLRRWLIRLVSRLGLYEAVQSSYLYFLRRYQSNTSFASKISNNMIVDLRGSSPYARNIYMTLKGAIEEEQRKNS